MTTMKTRWAPLAAAAVLMTCSPAAAEVSLGGMNLEGEVEAGVRLLPDEPSKTRRAKFEEYRDITEGPILGSFSLRAFRPDESYSTEFGGTKWGQQDQDFFLRAERLGVWRFEFDWDQTPHLYSTTAQSFYRETQRGVFRLDTPRPPLSSWNGSPRIDEISQRWDTARMSLTLTPTTAIELNAEYTRIRKDGDRPFGMAFGSPGNNFAEMLEPIEQTIHDLRLRGSVAHANWQLQFGYNLSIFQNDLSRVIFDNPCFGNATCGADAAGAQASGQTSLPPDNMAHTISIAGGLNLPFWRTRITGSFAWNIALQNQEFLPHTINPATAGDPDLALPDRSLHGNVQTFITNLSITSHPLPKLSLTARYRLFDVTDVSGEPIFPGHLVNDRGAVVREGRRAGRFDFRRQNVDLDARYQLFSPVAMTVGTGWEHWDRNSHREVPETDEFFGKLAVDVTPADWLLVRTTYRPSFRRINEYNTRAHAAHVVEEDPAASLQGQSILLRKFDEAERDRQRVDMEWQITPLDTLSITPSAGYRYDDYIASVLGLQQEVTWSMGIDVGWTPNRWLSVSGGYVHEVNEQKMRSRSRPVTGATTFDFADFEWISFMADTVDTVHGGFNVALLPGVLDWAAGVNYATATGRIETRNPVAPASGTAAQRDSARAKPMPAVTDSLLRLDAALKYHFAKAWTATLGYAFESFRKEDWRTDTLRPFVPGVTSIWLGNDARNYDAHIVGLTLSYRFR
jgi:MtrB/PioB family decaheme-associated outer membrane protein